MNTDPLCPQQHTHPKHSPNRCIFCEYGAAVRADALNAARKALRNECFHDTESEWCVFVAAIDALRGKP